MEQTIKQMENAQYEVVLQDVFLVQSDPKCKYKLHLVQESPLHLTSVFKIPLKRDLQTIEVLLLEADSQQTDPFYSQIGRGQLEFSPFEHGELQVHAVLFGSQRYNSGRILAKCQYIVRKNPKTTIKALKKIKRRRMTEGVTQQKHSLQQKQVTKSRISSKLIKYEEYHQAYKYNQKFVFLSQSTDYPTLRLCNVKLNKNVNNKKESTILQIIINDPIRCVVSTLIKIAYEKDNKSQVTVKISTRKVTFTAIQHDLVLRSRQVNLVPKHNIIELYSNDEERGYIHVFFDQKLRKSINKLNQLNTYNEQLTLYNQMRASIAPQLISNSQQKVSLIQQGTPPVRVSQPKCRPPQQSERGQVLTESERGYPLACSRNEVASIAPRTIRSLLPRINPYCDIVIRNIIVTMHSLRLGASLHIKMELDSSVKCTSVKNTGSRADNTHHFYWDDLDVSFKRVLLTRQLHFMCMDSNLCLAHFSVQLQQLSKSQYRTFLTNANSIVGYAIMHFEINPSSEPNPQDNASILNDKMLRKYSVRKQREDWRVDRSYVFDREQIASSDAKEKKNNFSQYSNRRNNQFIRSMNKNQINYQ